MKALALAAIAGFWAGTASAHPDHVTAPVDSLSHLVLDPFHLFTMGIAVVAILALRARRRRQSSRIR